MHRCNCGSCFNDVWWWKFITLWCCMMIVNLGHYHINSWTLDAVFSHLMPTGVKILGCILTPPGEYNWTIHVWRWCGLMSNYFDHLLLLLLLLLLTLWRYTNQIIIIILLKNYCALAVIFSSYLATCQKDSNRPMTKINTYNISLTVITTTAHHQNSNNYNSQPVQHSVTDNNSTTVDGQRFVLTANSH